MSPIVLDISQYAIYNYSLLNKSTVKNFIALLLYQTLLHMLQQINSKQILLIILDGWGQNSKYHGNAIKQANTPTLDLLWHNFPATLLNASENYVGLPQGQVGNSEVGHTTIGAGRTINQSLVRISKSIEKGDFFNNDIINSIYKLTGYKNKKIHLIGLCSDGGVHSHIDHLIALVKISQKYKNTTTCIHIITDGRDTETQSAIKFINILLENIVYSSNIQICTISGRYYSMDRDCRWQRTAKAYECLVTEQIDIQYNNDILKVIQDSYAKNINDEFILPTRINQGIIEEDDGIIFFNFRPDRMRQLVQAFSNNSFEGFKTKQFQNLNIATLTTYDSKLNLPVIFNKIPKNNFLGQVISEQGLKQFRLAETEKYAHVTYFFNGGQEEPFPGEDRELIPSPKVEQYDCTPEMSAEKITSKLIEITKKKSYNFIVANYANSDMIGHTGNLKATKKAIEIIDKCLHHLLQNITDKPTTIIITSDHGNADIMLNNNNETFKSHTKNLVPFIIINQKDYLNKTYHHNNIKLKQKGSLADIAPTILNLLNINIPNDMNGKSLIKTSNIKHSTAQKKSMTYFSKYIY